MGKYIAFYIDGKKTVVCFFMNRIDSSPMMRMSLPTRLAKKQELTSPIFPDQSHQPTRSALGRALSTLKTAPFSRVNV